MKETALRTVYCLACSAAIALTAFAPGKLHAQLFEMNHGHHQGLNLSAQEESTIERLESLDVLPEGQWLYHEGDVPHGEQPSLDDSNWQKVNAHPRPSSPADGAKGCSLVSPRD